MYTSAVQKPLIGPSLSPPGLPRSHPSLKYASPLLADAGLRAMVCHRHACMHPRSLLRLCGNKNQRTHKPSKKGHRNSPCAPRSLAHGEIVHMRRGFRFLSMRFAFTLCGDSK